MAPHSQFGLISARSTQIFRLAHQLTERSDTAVAAAVAAFARVPRRVRAGPRFDLRVTTELLRTVGTSDRHAAVVLAFGLGWDPESIGEACRRSRRSIRADVASALRQCSEEQWRETYAEPRWDLPVPPDLLALVAAERVRRRRTAVRRLLAGGVACTAAVASVVAVARVATAPGGLPPTAHIAGLLPWPARGELARDSAVRERAIRAWRAVAPAPAGQAYVLYAGDVDGIRLVVLQGYFEDTPAVAVVTDGHLARLRPLPRADPAALALTYEAGAGTTVTRLLVAPGVTGVSERASANSLGRRRAFVSRPLRDGLSAGWSVGAGATALRLTTASRSDTFLLGPDALLPEVVRPRLTPPPRRWSGLPQRVPLVTLRGDAAWFGQLCGDPQPSAAPVWSGRVPGFPKAIRVVRFRCAGDVVVRFLTGSGADAVTFRAIVDARPRLDAYAAVVAPPTAVGPPYLVVVGSRRVGHMDVAGEQRHTRVVVVRLQQTRGVRVFARDGTPVVLR